MAFELGVSVKTLWGWETDRWQPTIQGREPELLHPIWNVCLCQHKRLARDFYDPLIRSTTGGGWEATGSTGDVRANDGKIAAVQFPNSRTPPAGECLSTVRVRVRTESFNIYHAILVPIAAKMDHRIRNRRIKLKKSQLPETQRRKDNPSGVLTPPNHRFLAVDWLNTECDKIAWALKT